MPTLRSPITLMLVLAIGLTAIACRRAAESPALPTPGPGPTDTLMPSTPAATDQSTTPPAESPPPTGEPIATPELTPGPPPAGLVWNEPSGAFSVADAPAGAVSASSGGLAGQLFIVGTTDDEAASAVWRSADGQAWQRIVLPDSADVALQAITDGPNGLAAVGFSYGSEDPVPAGWHSRDGLAWQPISGDMGAGEMRVVAAGGDGYLALGSDPVTGEVLGWTSADGIAWSIGSPVSGIDGGTTLNGLSAVTDGYLAYGSATSAEAAVWHSIDGVAWQAIALPNGSDSTVNEIAVSSGLYVAVGARTDDELAQSMAWYSLDGRSWEISVDGGDGAMYGVAPLGEGFVAVGAIELARFRFDAAAWLSADGRTWFRLADDPTFHQARMYDALPGGGGVVVIGERSDELAEVSQPTLWVARGE
jgi:hypothetical protein